ncbi:hypothetical protein [Planctopirus hydrillae]|uniref:Uncharacterized protein n=1 Tax=Planctopirus hydrillae TaxID=1841610 RepID=A0A1C3EU34_9PLAN|nr:hypothetical protein [Planctopirus hydrillae]ODA36812.1 hypothetical protein A6X21_01700 [Planctopirus hydrillae]
MNLCLRFVTSTVMGLNLAAILLAAILALPAAYADELPPEDEGGGGMMVIQRLFQNVQGIVIAAYLVPNRVMPATRSAQHFV